MSNKKSQNSVVSGKLPSDTFEQFDQFRTERGLTKSDAVRRLISEGLQEQSKDDAPLSRLLDVHRAVMFVLALAGLVGWVLGIATAAESAALSAFCGVNILAIN